jgi:DNA polymerase III epsilon subunit-like protein
MRYLSLDLETTGLGDNCQILQLAAVLDDTEKPLEVSPTFNALVWDYWYGGEPYALALNHQIFETLSKCKPGDETVHRGNIVQILEPDNLIPSLWDWLKIYDLGRVVLAGKNVAGFDLRFLKNLSGWSEIPVHHRVLDPGNLFLRPDDREPPSTDECLRRAGINTSAQHDALSDAYDVCKLIRNWELREKSLR